MSGGWGGFWECVGVLSFDFTLPSDCASAAETDSQEGPGTHSTLIDTSPLGRMVISIFCLSAIGSYHFETASLMVPSASTCSSSSVKPCLATSAFTLCLA